MLLLPVGEEEEGEREDEDEEDEAEGRVVVDWEVGLP